MSAVAALTVLPVPTEPKPGVPHGVVAWTLARARKAFKALEYVEAMWRMLQQDQPDDYVLGTVEAHSVQEFVETAST